MGNVYDAGCGESFSQASTGGAAGRSKKYSNLALDRGREYIIEGTY